MDALNRNAIIIHLGDLRAIECGLYELEQGIRKCDHYISQAAIPQIFKEPTNDNHDSAAGSIITSIVVGLFCPGIGWLIDDFINIFSESSIFTTIGWIIGIIIAIVGIMTGLSEKDSVQEAYNREYATYLRNLENDRKRVEKERFEKSRVTRQRREFYSEYQQLLQLRDNVYSLNIIPSKFRNLYCIYNLYDFMSTSAGSLNDALMNCNLEIIQQQLKYIIEQNRTIILNQYIQQAQNRELLASNQQMLRQLRNIEANTETSAQYARIAASNSEVCSYMLTATYMQNMIR